MLIRSQNKAAIVNLDNVFNIATIRNINGAVAIYIGSQGSCCNMAEYSTKAKAMKVLDMIQEAYCEFMAVRNDDMWCGKESVFQMPEDSEVVV